MSLLALGLASQFSLAQQGSLSNPSDYINDRIQEAIAIATEKQASAKKIPQEVINRAAGIAIIEITRGGFGVAGQHGSGVLIVRNGTSWSAPCAFSASGGSIGFQVGLEVKKLIYILNNKSAVEAFTQDEKVKLSAVANATAGPDHVAEDANTMAKYDVYVYSLSDGAFAGAAVGAESVGIDQKANARTYGKDANTTDIITGKAKPHALAKKLYQALGLN
jgi:lipid-binding SYLF domain-containing protein